MNKDIFNRMTNKQKLFKIINYLLKWEVKVKDNHIKMMMKLKKFSLQHLIMIILKIKYKMRILDKIKK